MATITYSLTIYEADGSTPLVTITSVRGGTNPYIAQAPSGDGASFNPRTLESIASSYTVQVADWPIGSSQRILTAILEDSDGRQQLGYRRADLTMSVNGGGAVFLVAGVVTGMRLLDAMTWEVAIGDNTQVQSGYQIFGANDDTLISDMLAAWPNRGCIFGGPVIGGFLNTAAGTKTIPDLGGWRMRVAEVSSVGTSLERYRLAPVSVYGPPLWLPSPTATTNMAATINDAVADLWNPGGPGNNFGATSFTTIRDAYAKSAWSGVIFLVDGVVFRPTVTDFAGPKISDHDAHAYELVNTLDGRRGVWCWKDQTGGLSVGDLVTVRCLTIQPSELSPIYLDRNPLTLMADLWTLPRIGSPLVTIPYDSAALAAVQQDSSVGEDLSLACRIVEAHDLGAFITSVCQEFGIGLRMNDAAEITPFIARRISPILPTATITTADVVPGTVKPFDHDATEGLKEFEIHTVEFFRGPPSENKKVVDNVTVVESSSNILNNDPGALPSGKGFIQAPGMVHSVASGAVSPGYLGFVVKDQFSRFGRGPVAVEMTLLRGGIGDSLALGDDRFVDLPQLPNANYRLGDNGAISPRVMQLVRRTVKPEGYDVRLVDSGPNAQPLATKPTITIAASTDMPRTVAEFTITNAATLNGLTYGAIVQWAVVPSGTPASTAYHHVAYFDPGLIPTGAVMLPGVAAGSKVFVKGVSISRTDRQSAFSTPVSVTLTAVDVPTSVTATPDTGDGSRCLIEWTPGANATDDVTDVYIRAQGAAFSTARLVGTVLPGSTRFQLAELTPSALYTASVQHRGTLMGDVSAIVDVDFTADATTRTLEYPVYPQPFAGSIDPFTGQPILDGLYGIAVVAPERPGFVEIGEAVESAPGSGSFGSFATVGLVPSVQSNWTLWSAIAPQDGKKRRLKMRHVGIGQTSSAYTSPVDVLPWTPLALVAYPTQLFIEVVINDPADAVADKYDTIRVHIYGVDPQGGVAEVKMDVSANMTLDGGSPNPLNTLEPDGSRFDVNLPLATAGMGSIICDAQVPDGRTVRQTLPIAPRATLAGAQGTTSVSTNGYYEIFADGGPDAQSCLFLVNTGAPTQAYPSEASVRATGMLNVGSVLDYFGPFQVNFADDINATIIFYTGAAGDGQELKSIHLHGNFASFDGTKTVSYGGSDWVLVGDDAGVPLLPGPTNGQIPANPGGTYSQQVQLTMLAAGGVLLHEAEIDLTWDSSPDQFASVNASILGAGVTATAACSPVGAQSHTLSLADNPGGTITAQIDWTTATSTPGRIGKVIPGGVSLTYIMTYPFVTL